MPRYRQVDSHRFQLKTILDTVSVKMGSFQVSVSVYAGEIGDHIPVYMIDAPRSLIEKISMAIQMMVNDSFCFVARPLRPCACFRLVS